MDSNSQAFPAFKVYDSTEEIYEYRNRGPKSNLRNDGSSLHVDVIDGVVLNRWGAQMYRLCTVLQQKICEAVRANYAS